MEVSWRNTLADINKHMYIDDDWYNLNEMAEFMTLERSEIITEVVGVKTRMKLARSARRTAKRRAFLRKLRERKRKQNPALQKRAYYEVKSAFRKRLYRGNWKKLSYSSRARIDAIISKKKPIFKSMVKRIMPSVRRGESTRLQSLQKRNINKSRSKI